MGDEIAYVIERSGGWEASLTHQKHGTPANAELLVKAGWVVEMGSEATVRRGAVN